AGHPLRLAPAAVRLREHSRPGLTFAAPTSGQVATLSPSLGQGTPCVHPTRHQGTRPTPDTLAHQPAGVAAGHLLHLDATGGPALPTTATRADARRTPGAAHRAGVAHQ